MVSSIDKSAKLDPTNDARRSSVPSWVAMPRSPKWLTQNEVALTERHEGKSFIANTLTSKTSVAPEGTMSWSPVFDPLPYASSGGIVIRRRPPTRIGGEGGSAVPRTPCFQPVISIEPFTGTSIVSPGSRPPSMGRSTPGGTPVIVPVYVTVMSLSSVTSSPEPTTRSTIVTVGLGPAMGESLRWISPVRKRDARFDALTGQFAHQFRMRQPQGALQHGTNSVEVRSQGGARVTCDDFEDVVEHRLQRLWGDAVEDRFFGSVDRRENATRDIPASAPIPDRGHPRLRRDQIPDLGLVLLHELDPRPPGFRTFEQSPRLRPRLGDRASPDVRRPRRQAGNWRAGQLWHGLNVAWQVRSGHAHVEGLLYVGDGRGRTEKSDTGGTGAQGHAAEIDAHDSIGRRREVVIDAGRSGIALLNVIAKGRYGEKEQCVLVGTN